MAGNCGHAPPATVRAIMIMMAARHAEAVKEQVKSDINPWNRAAWSMIILSDFLIKQKPD